MKPHLHVVSAGNSQRNSLAVFECQEELNNAIFPPFHDAPTRRKPSLRTSRNTKPHRTSTREEVVTPHTYAPTTENGTCHSIYPARQLFTVPDLEDYAMQTRKGRPGVITQHSHNNHRQRTYAREDDHTLL
ncbi:hypothetical protein PENSUB_177 [Penicillium subrubescens]|jgi:hypothetical protein|uniref:Uncharacterized protein n=1 Tax=Penicillium subrubescens TaxID=1316194 RepID=A0A1Q5UNS0_9EURO|nr:hypothetical protein PENSUB_177 [Penicillium subrubescens]